jgi:hypothetical protein
MRTTRRSKAAALLVPRDAAALQIRAVASAKKISSSQNAPSKPSKPTKPPSPRGFGGFGSSSRRAESAVIERVLRNRPPLECGRAVRNEHSYRFPQAAGLTQATGREQASAIRHTQAADPTRTTRRSKAAALLVPRCAAALQIRAVASAKKISSSQNELPKPPKLPKPCLGCRF